MTKPQLFQGLPLRGLLGILAALASIFGCVAFAAQPVSDAPGLGHAGHAGTFCVTDYGAVGDGKAMNTVAIQKAVDACASAGGGRVVVPAGTFVSGPIFLKSNIEFHLVAGAVLRASRIIDEYPLLDVKGHGYHIDRWWHASLLTGTHLENVSITGKGVLDGQGDAWWKPLDAGQLTNIRPMVFFLFDCERVRIDGVKIIDSPSWTTVSILCRNTTFHDVTVQNPWKPYHNCDGINFVSCSNVRVSNCSIDTGDDGITLKSLPDFGMVSGPKPINGEWKPDYSKPRIPCENFMIDNCLVQHGHSGVGIWAEVIGGMQNIAVSNCVFDGTRVGIKINRWPHPGGFVRNVRVNNIVMRRVEAVFEVSSYFDPKAIAPGPDADASPEMSNIHFSNITATQARIACESRGFPKMPVRDISFSHIRIQADKGFEFENGENVLFDDVTVDCPGPAVIAKNVHNLEIRRLDVASPQAGVPAIQLESCRDAWIYDCRMPSGHGPFVGLADANNSGLIIQGGPKVLSPTTVPPCPTWSYGSYAYSGSSMWRMSGHRNLFLPVPAAVMKTLRREWDEKKIDFINGVQRLESGARPDVVLPPGDRREIYIIMGWGFPETLLIAEDGELILKAEKFDYQEFLK